MSLPIYEQTQAVGRLSLSTASPGDYTGSATSVLATGTSSPGSYYYDLQIAATGDTSAGMIRFFTNDSSTKKLKFSIPVPENQADVMVNGRLNPPWNSGLLSIKVQLPSASWTLEVNSETADQFHITVNGYSYV